MMISHYNSASINQRGRVNAEVYFTTIRATTDELFSIKIHYANECKPSRGSKSALCHWMEVVDGGDGSKKVLFRPLMLHNGEQNVGDWKPLARFCCMITSAHNSLGRKKGPSRCVTRAHCCHTVADLISGIAIGQERAEIFSFDTQLFLSDRTNFAERLGSERKFRKEGLERRDLQRNGRPVAINNINFPKF